jgi:hypothetical protein
MAVRALAGFAAKLARPGAIGRLGGPRVAGATGTRCFNTSVLGSVRGLHEQPSLRAAGRAVILRIRVAVSRAGMPVGSGVIALLNCFPGPCCI